MCNSWGGSAMPLIPVTAHEPIDSRWQRILLESNIDGIARTDLLATEERSRYSDIDGGNYRQLLLRVLIELEGQKPIVQTCRGVPHDHLWYLAYLTLFGDLPAGPDPMNGWNDLVAGLTYQDVRPDRCQYVRFDFHAASCGIRDEHVGVFNESGHQTASIRGLPYNFRTASTIQSAEGRISISMSAR